MLLNQSQVVAAGFVEMACVRVPQTVNRIMGIQASTRGISLEGLFDCPRCHMASSIARQNQRVFRAGRLAHTLLPEDVFAIMVSERSVEPDNPFLAALAPSDEKRRYVVPREDVAAFELRNLHNAKARRQRQMYDEVIANGNFVAVGSGYFGPSPRGFEKLYYFLPGEELLLVQYPVESCHVFLGMCLLLSKRFAWDARCEPLERS